MNRNALPKLIEFLDNCFSVQISYADDGNAADSLHYLKYLLKKHVHVFGYHLLFRNKMFRIFFQFIGRN